ncbi:uncharacterized protein LOC119725635 [Patiria miniata]|uniref:Uncharacterized protein n=1 Tax=Patiria miniata TaxID=46514 RepID=A0A913ZMS1_PATMI|nr:uncharacterized protein LOC119725635 [Patiria miniata]
MAVRYVIALSVLMMLLNCDYCSTYKPNITAAGGKGPCVVDACMTEIAKIMQNVIGRDISTFIRRIGYVESQFGAHGNTYRENYHGGIWQLDEDGFLETQAIGSHSYLQGKLDFIKTTLGIDWLKVTWQDMRKPLYSAIASLLYLGNISPIIPPDSDINGQAQYWKDHYNTQSGEGTVQHFTDNVQLLEGPNGPKCHIRRKSGIRTRRRSHARRQNDFFFSL